MVLKVGWWNTGLSPNANQNRANDADVATASNIILHLLLVEEIDFLALGEVIDKDIKIAQENLNSELFCIVKSFTKPGKSEFNMIFIFRRDKFILSGEVTDIILSPIGLTYKVAKRIDLLALETFPIYILASHWPSALTPLSPTDKESIGNELRREIQDILKIDSSASIIAMGDYNDEPFNNSIRDALKSTRCPEIAIGRTSLLFNPFWKDMCPSPRIDSQYTHGTCYYSSGILEKWRTFDQIMFSSDFLTGQKLRFAADSAGVYHDNALVELVTDRHSHFDHLPVYAVIEEAS